MATIGPARSQRIRDRWPERTEQLLRAVLQDACFDLERDFDATLAKFKGDQMRRPPTVGHRTPRM